MVFAQLFISTAMFPFFFLHPTLLSTGVQKDNAIVIEWMKDKRAQKEKNEKRMIKIVPIPKYRHIYVLPNFCYIGMFKWVTEIRKGANMIKLRYVLLFDDTRFCSRYSVFFRLFSFSFNVCNFFFLSSHSKPMVVDVFFFFFCSTFSHFWRATPQKWMVHRIQNETAIVIRTLIYRWGIQKKKKQKFQSQQ